MSTQPGAMTAGTPARGAASTRSGPALNTPPHTSSASSVVVMSSDPVMYPSVIRLSIVLPPVPVAWKIRTSKPWSSRTPRAYSTQVVVLPNMETLIRGFASAGNGASILTIPAMAPAALA